MSFGAFYLILDIRVNLVKTRLPVREQTIITKIFTKIQNSSKFFEIMENLLSSGDLETRAIILDILTRLGKNTFYSRLLLEKLDTPANLIHPKNATRSLVYLNYGEMPFLL